MSKKFLLLAALAWSLVNCGGYHNPNTTSAAPSLESKTQVVSSNPMQVTFADVSKVFQGNQCLNCHAGTHPADKLDLTQYASAKAAAKDIQADVDSGKMPKKAPPVDAADRAIVDTWVTQGAPN